MTVLFRRARLPLNTVGDFCSRGTTGWLRMQDGRIVDQGFGDEPRTAVAADVESIDCDRGWLLPAFCESHAHVHYAAQQSAMIDFSGVGKVHKDFCSRFESGHLTDVRARPGDWILGFGWEEELLNGLEEDLVPWLDRLAPHSPVFVWSWDHHRALVNTEAAKRLDPKNAPLGPGVWQESDALAGWNRIPTAPHQLEQEIDRWLARGVTAVATFDGWSSLRAFQELEAQGRLALRVRHSIPWEASPDSLPDIAADTDRLSVLWVKLFLDGTLGSRTAWVFDEYLDRAGSNGQPRVSEDEFTKGLEGWLSATADGNSDRSLRSLGLAIHAIGDHAVDTSVEWIERLQSRRGRMGLDRIEHVQLVRSASLERMGKIEVSLGLQPCHWKTDSQEARKAWGESRLLDVHPWSRLHATGATILLGTDAPIAEADPWANLQIATQTNPGENPARASARLRFADAFAGYTVNACHPLRLPTDWGTLKPGAPADLQWLRSDTPLDEIACIDEAGWAATWMDGHCEAGPDSLKEMP